MTSLIQLVLLRHGETVGDSSIRFHGAGDVALSDEGREQARAAARAIEGLSFDVVVASPLERALATAKIVAPDALVEVEPDFREIHFGRWEGLTREEIQRLDPQIHDAWQRGGEDFAFPDGEARSAFQQRVREGLARLLERPVVSVLVVAHKGVVRTIVEALTGDTLAAGEPGLGCHVELVRDEGGDWHRK